MEEVVGVTGYDSHKAIQGESMANALIRFKSGKCAEFEGLVTQAAVNIRPFFRLFGQMVSRAKMCNLLYSRQTVRN